MSEPRSLATIFRPFDDIPTLSDAQGPSSAPLPVDPAVSPTSTGTAPRYEVRSVLGRGGMGEVRLCRDARIGRDVAVKVAHPEVGRGEAARARFLREARIQAQLEHPSIVPVHDVDMLDDGAAYFAMKRVRGETLAHVLAKKSLPRRKLLAAFNSVCLAVDFAHSRGVLHRDLKPGNIMLGDFGEVYVLDWGLAKIVDVDDDKGVMGTPGYMAPEQIDASHAPLSPATDVYALGAVLFEILAGRPLLEATDEVERTLDAIHGVDPSPARRAPGAGIPTELDAICVTALARAPGDRFPSARALHDAVDAHLAGEHDVERRRELSRVHALAATASIERGQRAAALHELGSALALDPENAPARGALIKLLTTPPQETPPEVTRRIEEKHVNTVREGARLSAVTTLGFIPSFLFALWIGVEDWIPFLVVGAGAVALAIGSAVVARMRRPTLLPQYLNVTLSCAAYLAIGRILGPFMLLPAMLVGLAVAMQTHPLGSVRRTSLAIVCSAILVAFGLEVAGVIDPSYAFDDGVMHVKQHMLKLGPAIPWFLLVCTVGAIVAPSAFVRRIRGSLDETEAKMQLHTWQLEQLVAEKT